MRARTSFLVRPFNREGEVAVAARWVARVMEGRLVVRLALGALIGWGFLKRYAEAIKQPSGLADAFQEHAVLCDSHLHVELIEGGEERWIA